MPKKLETDSVRGTRCFTSEKKKKVIFGEVFYLFVCLLACLFICSFFCVENGRAWIIPFQNSGVMEL